MKIFNKKDRILIGEKNKNIINLMDKEYEIYKQLCTSHIIGAHDYEVCQNVNLQCRTSLICNANCPFCIEKDSCKNNEVNTLNYVHKLDKALIELNKKDIHPSVTITGGEPCADKLKLNAILKTLYKNNVKKFNLNTNGILIDNEIIDMIKTNNIPYINISLHHYDLNKNKFFFGGKSITYQQLKFIIDNLGGTYYDKTRIRLQCVMMKNGIDSIEEIKKYTNFAKSLGLDNVAFRGLSKLKTSIEINELHKFCDKYSFDIFNILNKLQNDDEFKFNCQNISDHYMYEDWIFNGVDIHFAYSDMDILEKREKKELKDNIKYAREFVIYEDGSFCGGWNKNMKKIY